MITDVLVADEGSESTAQRVVSYLAGRGLDRAAIRGEHLEPLYAALSKSAHTPLGRSIQIPHLETADTPVDDAVWGIIIETREHPALEYVVNQFSEQLGIGIQLFHVAANESFIRKSKISSLMEQGKVILTPIRVETFSQDEYNALFLSRNFWETLQGRKKILVFQTDAILCAGSDYKLADFLCFDYIGSKWPRKRPVGIIADGGSGGLSLRDWQKSVDCLGYFSPNLWPGGEDGFFAFHLDLIGSRIGRGDECARFGTQHEFLCGSFGGHKITDLDPSSRERFIKYCPDVNHIL